MNRTRIAALAGAVCLTAIACGALAAREEYTLARKLQKGDELHGRLNASMKGTVEVSVASESKRKSLLTASVDIALRNKVADVDADGVATIGKQIDKLTVKMKSGDKEKVLVVSDHEARVTVNGSTKPLEGGG